MLLREGGAFTLQERKEVFFYVSDSFIDRSSSSLTEAWKSTIRYGMAWHGLLYIDLAFSSEVWFSIISSARSELRCG